MEVDGRVRPRCRPSGPAGRRGRRPRPRPSTWNQGREALADRPQRGDGPGRWSRRCRPGEPGPVVVEAREVASRAARSMRPGRRWPPARRPPARARRHRAGSAGLVVGVQRLRWWPRQQLAHDRRDTGGTAGGPRDRCPRPHPVREHRPAPQGSLSPRPSSGTRASPSTASPRASPAGVPAQARRCCSRRGPPRPRPVRPWPRARLRPTAGRRRPPPVPGPAQLVPRRHEHAGHGPTAPACGAATASLTGVRQAPLHGFGRGSGVPGRSSGGR